jgi:3-deoxy-D-manno-octulosonic-acid transferase
LFLFANFVSFIEIDMKLLYNIGIGLYNTLLYIASLFNEKAKLLVNGRKGWEKRLAEKLDPAGRNIWVHCSSLGEFEQGRPLIEEITRLHPEYKIFLTFFSPSGFEIRKNYSGADCVEYLPADFRGNAKRFIDLVNPEFVIFVKYEFWYNYISRLHDRGIPLYLVSGIFRPGQHFFRWYGSFFRNILRMFTVIFVQDKQSLDLLVSQGITNGIQAGDTRFDRVIKISGTAREIPQLEQFRGTEKIFLAGSSWKPDEEIMAAYINKYPSAMKWVFAPHEIDKPNIDRLESLFRVKVARFSTFQPANADARVLIIDNIGMLSSAYKYATIAGIGGGFGKGIHNILEPACWSTPVLFGPNFKKFREAVGLISEGGAFTYSNQDEFNRILDKLLSDDEFCSSASSIAGKFVGKHSGATAAVLSRILT